MMKTVLRICAAFFALAILGGVIQLGVLSGTQSKYVVWFGIASAIAAPIGLSLFGFALARSDGDIIKRLAKVPEIERLVAEARTQEERLRLLEGERLRLAEVIRLESRRQAVRDRMESLERDAVRILSELNNLDIELTTLDATIGDGIASEEIQNLRERVQSRIKDDVSIRLGNRTYNIDKSVVNAIPFGLGHLLVIYFRVIQDLGDRLLNMKLNKDASAE